MIRLSLAEIAAAVHGEVHDAPDPTVQVTGPVVIDSRQAVTGCLFVALSGEHTDGHRFAEAATAAGAAAVLAERPVGVAAVVVPDAVAALGRLAAAVALRLPAVTVGVTGSAGKTSTKDLIAQLLTPHGETVAPPGSFNNELGFPLTVLSAGEATRHLVLELGARGPGHIRYLTDLVQPRIGVVLNVGTAHLGEFGSRETIAEAKGELVEALPEDGVAVLNADDPLVAAMAGRTKARVVTFGESTGAQVRAERVRLDSLARPTFRLYTPWGEAEVTLAVHGMHQVSNALAAVAVAGEAGVAFDQLVAALGSAGPVSRWRMEVTERGDGVTVVNDAYNANPDSVRAALKALVAMAGARRTWAVLGEMAELGPTAAEEHDAIGRLAVRLDVNRLVAVGAPGSPAARLHAGAAQEGSWGGESVLVPDVPAAIELLSRELAPGDVVLVKASRAAALEQVAAALLVSEGTPA